MVVESVCQNRLGVHIAWNFFKVNNNYSSQLFLQRCGATAEVYFGGSESPKPKVVWRNRRSTNADPKELDFARLLLVFRL